MRRPLRSLHALKLVVVPADLAAPRRSDPKPPLPPLRASRSAHDGRSAPSSRRASSTSRGMSRVDASARGPNTRSPTRRICSSAGIFWSNSTLARRAPSVSGVSGARSRRKTRVSPSRVFRRTCDMIVVLRVRIDARAARARVFDRRRRVGGERILGAGAARRAAQNWSRRRRRDAMKTGRGSLLPFAL
eukprot:31339-Pelagococcus_subviridis.AAC.6